MSKITSPILLDTTGQDINETLNGIKDALLGSNTLIEDTTTSNNRVWSSAKIVEALTVSKTEKGAQIICTPIAATPITVEVEVPEPMELVLSQSNGAKTFTYTVYVPAAGAFNFSTGTLMLPDGNSTSLVGNSIMALKGANTYSINVESMNLTYRTIASGEGSSEPWDVIFGGSAAEEV